jgi:GntR family transcriptional regulator of gluconate operon
MGEEERVMQQAATGSTLLPRHNLSAGVYNHLWEGIVRRSLYSPGARLSDSQLALEFGLSRGPVREALQKLEVEGLVTSTAGHGFRVRTFTDDDVDEIYLLRGVLEALASQLTAGRLSEVQLRVLQSLVSRMGEQSRLGRWKAVLDTDMEFHETIVAAARHQRLYLIWLQLRSQIILIANFTARLLYRDLTDIEARHQAIVDVLRAKTPTAAAEISRAHVLEVHAILRERRETQRDDMELTSAAAKK